MFNYFEKKLNTWIIDVLLAGSSIETKDMSPSGKSFFEKVKSFFARGLQQMSKELAPQTKKSRKPSLPKTVTDNDVAQ